ncbi:MAG: MBL fold metallo-hydrolase [Acutalibacteraceae bacterium]
MFKLIQCAENTYYLSCFSNIGVYDLKNGEVILIDSGDHKKSVHDLDKILEERNWRVKAIFNTHSHIDHITGNKYFTEKYGCEVYASEIERLIVNEPNIEGSYLFNGVPVRRLPDGRLTDKGVHAKILTKAVLPDGFETAPLPGHNFNMIAIKTPDDVWFIGDSILMKETFDEYKIPFFLNINKSIETIKKLSELKGKVFVPSHVPASEDISELAAFNIQRIEQLKEYFFESCKGLSVEELIEKADNDLSLRLNPDKYAKVSLTVKSYLQSLLEDGRITADIERSRLVYRQKNKA